METHSQQDRRTLLAVFIIIIGQLLAFIGMNVHVALFVFGLLVMLVAAFVTYLWPSSSSMGRFRSPGSSFERYSHCGFCGNRMKSDLAYCPRCGNKVV